MIRIRFLENVLLHTLEQWCCECVKERTVLVDQHAERDPVGVKAVQEVLNVGAGKGVEAELLLVLDHALGHGGNHVIVPVPDLDKNLQETAEAYRILMSCFMNINDGWVESGENSAGHDGRMILQQFMKNAT